MATTSSMFMYSLTIQPPSAITQAILGQFAGTKEQQIVTASGSKLTIHRPDALQGRISALFSHDCFGIIRTLAAFRLAGSSKGMFPSSLRRAYSDSFKMPTEAALTGPEMVDTVCSCDHHSRPFADLYIDYMIVGSDSGRITILEYIPAQNRFNRIHLETFGKSGVRRVIPGQYLAVDPKGRACMIASVEKNKLVYVLNRNAQAELTISSPLEAHRPQTLVFDLVALDCGYENPIFATLEIDYTESDQDPTGQAFDEIEKC